MDSLTLATAFSSVISLIADFRSQRSESQTAEYTEFTEWLGDNRHDEILRLLNQNLATSLGVKGLLSEDRETLRSRLDALDRSLATLASALEGFSGLAMALRPEAMISAQAVSILRQFESSGASKALRSDVLGSKGPLFIFLDGRGGELQLDDGRFADDDFGTLLELGLLRQSHNSTGKPIFVLTRAAAAFVMQLAGSPQA